MACISLWWFCCVEIFSLISFPWFIVFLLPVLPVLCPLHHCQGHSLHLYISVLSLSVSIFRRILSWWCKTSLWFVFWLMQPSVCTQSVKDTVPSPLFLLGACVENKWTLYAFVCFQPVFSLPSILGLSLCYCNILFIKIGKIFWNQQWDESCFAPLFHDWFGYVWSLLFPSEYEINNCSICMFW